MKSHIIAFIFSFLLGTNASAQPIPTHDIVIYGGTAAGVTAAVQGLCSLGEPGFGVSQLDEDGTLEGVAKVLGRALRSDFPPSAVIAIRPRQLATALSWLLSAGQRVPEDVSLLSLGHEPFLDHLWPEVSGYWVSPEMVARRLVRRIEALCQGQRRSGGSPWITPEFRKGGSIGVAR